MFIIDVSALFEFSDEASCYECRLPSNINLNVLFINNSRDCDSGNLTVLYQLY